MTESKVYIGPLDYFSSCAKVFYFYDGVVDFKDIERAFEKALDVIPILSSVIASETIGGKLLHYYKPIRPSNVEIIQKNVKDEIFDFYKPDPDSENPFNQEEGYVFSGLVEKIKIADETYTLNLVENSPLLKVTVCYTETSKKTIIGNSWNHILGDFWSVNQYMKCFASILSKPDHPPFDFSRKMMVESKLEKTEEEEEEGEEGIPEETRKKFITYFRKLQDESYVDYDADDYHLTLSEAIYKLIPFSDEKLQLLKNVVVKEKSDKFRFSSFDCVSALVWKIHALRHENDDEILPFLFYMNFRNRIPGFGWNYFGNCIVTPTIELTRREIIETPFSDLVMMISNMKNSVDEKDLYHIVKNWDSESKNMFRRKTLWVNDWRMGDRFKPHFGDIKCERFITYPPYWKDKVRYNFAHLFLRREGESGMAARVAFKHEFLKKTSMAEMSVDDFATLEGVEKLKEIMAKV